MSDTNPPMPFFWRIGPLPWSDTTIAKIQSGTGMFIGSFLTLHFVELASAYYGPMAYNEALRLFRRIYQNKVYEAALVGSTIVHVLAGLTYSRRRTAAGIDTKSMTLFQRLSIYSGNILMACVPAHFVTTRLVSLFKGSDYLADFSLVTWTLENQPLFYYPFYSALACAGFYHFLYNTIKTIRRYDGMSLTTYRKIVQSRLWWPAVGAGCAFLIGSVLSFSQGFRFTIDSERYEVFAKGSAWLDSLANPHSWFNNRRPQQ